MKITNTPLAGCFVLEPQVFGDARGSFMESYNEQKFPAKVHFVQDNQSISQKGVLRGLHFQKGEHAQAKLVRVIRGEVLDVAVDIRPDSETFGQHFSIILNAENNKQLFVPRGFAHGFAVLEDNTIFAYKCDNFYHKEAESGIIYNDPDIAIDWMLDDDEIMLSDKDKLLPNLKMLSL
ncbi:dTDP-4-dehydrorhamnose 3,5-epimerase [Kordia periserrulae]|uniref:dTDP-4-dehydrorhamnose 3,5-epimerase n=1 Tax=Kordia periserrulae TaxID=701523 RepID=A0A2T6BWK7_9FLAO|nr:dTDP-4-dehydrorhamnose 3,5-epimerase [Kordia periserrulae]PTX60449.1 dTDP-4-dehydrorhamnose 3,5-epimerase [Kordia periserrulae]